MRASGPKISLLPALASAALLLLSSGLFNPSAIAAQEASVPRGENTPRAVATEPRLDSHGDLTRLAFRISRAVPVQAFVLANPDRVVVDLPEVDFQIDPNAGRAAAADSRKPASRRRGKAGVSPVVQPLAGQINSWRAGLFVNGRSRVIIDLAGPVRISRALTETAVDGSSRLVLEITRSDRESFLAATRKASVAVAATPAPPVSTAIFSAERPVVVIDAGHGGVDDGAHGQSGAVEKDIVLDVARSIAARLNKLDRYNVVMTRSTDVFVPLSDRVKIARDAGATLFISVHADTLVDEPQVAGATVYTLSDKASDSEAARLAEKENQSDAVAGIEGREDKGEVSDILFDLTRRETRAFSHVFARTLVDYFAEVARLNKNARRGAGFRVLKAPDVPSVLLELGYLSSEKDAANLVSAEWRERVAGAVASAVDRFFRAGANQRVDSKDGIRPEQRLEASFAHASDAAPAP